MEAELDKDKSSALALLEQGLAEDCADYIAEVIVNLDTGTCDYVELCPALQEVASKDVFHFFDRANVGDSLVAKADVSRPVSLRALAEKAIVNLQANSGLSSHSLDHRILKSNRPQWIKHVLEHLIAQGSTDQSLIPILEKIARKNVHRSYTMHNGLSVDCQLEQRATKVIDMIRHPEFGPSPWMSNRDGNCPVCSSLPKELTVNYGRDEPYPAAYRKLIGIDQETGATYRCCPECRNYFFCVDMPQEYGTGNNAEEEIGRFTTEQSRYLENLFMGNELFSLNNFQVEECFLALPVHQLLPPLDRLRNRLPDVFGQFVGHLVKELMKRDDQRISDMLIGYVAGDPKRAENVLRRFATRAESPRSRLLQHCVNVIHTKEKTR